MYPFAIALAAFVVATVLILGLTRWVDWILLSLAKRFRQGVGGRPRASVWWISVWLFLLVASGFLFSTALAGGSILRLGVAFSVLFLAHLCVPLYRKHRHGSLEQTAIPYFHGLLGLVRVGVSLPLAMFRLSEASGASFPKTLRIFLKRFREGVPLVDCLAQFRRRSGVRRAAFCLAMLEMAYARGLPVVPVLERMVPLLEAEELARARIRSIQATILLQGAFASVMPWGIAAFLNWMDPESLEAFRESGVAGPIIGGAMVLEGVGGYLLWKVSQYY